MCMSEKDFEKMIKGANLKEKEINVIRGDLGMKVTGEVETDPVFKNRLRIIAWGKIPH